MNQRIDECAKRFFYQLVPGHSGPYDYTDHKAKPLIVAAFTLYCKAWGGFDIRRWEWPFKALAEGIPFAGDEPWTVLFRRAAEIAKAERREAA